MTRTLYRSRTDRMLLGVCGGFAVYFGVDVTAIRALAVLLAWLSGGAAVLAYFVIALFVPEEPVGADPASARTVPYAWPRDAAVTGKDAVMDDQQQGGTPSQPEGQQPMPSQPEAQPPAPEQPGAQPAPTQPEAPMPGPAPGPGAVLPPYPPQPMPPGQQPQYGQQPQGQPPAWGQQGPHPGWGQEQHPRRGRGGITGGIILIVIGLLFLAQQVVPGLDIGRLWPVILIVLGLAIIFRRR